MALSLGTDFTLVLTESGSVYAFGTNRNGQLGLGNLRNQLIPALLDKVDAFAGEEVSMVSAGHVHSACVTHDGNAWVWGSNLWGQAGLDQIAHLVEHGQAHDILRPALVPRVHFGNSPALMVACGVNFTLLLTAAGHVWSAGNNSHGQLGHNDTLHNNLSTTLLHSLTLCPFLTMPLA
jgi:alpha-tubulin suppressor-like RCC1 family protein